MLANVILRKETVFPAAMKPWVSPSEYSGQQNAFQPGLDAYLINHPAVAQQ